MSVKDLSEILSPREKRSLADEVTASIREAILRGQLAPGERLREESLAKSLNVSRGTVRAAMPQLRSLRLNEFYAQESLQFLSRSPLFQDMGVDWLEGTIDIFLHGVLE